MSYSRWSHSYWYTFREVQGRGEDLFCVMGMGGSVIRFTIKELREDLNKCLTVVRNKDQHGDLQELKEYIGYFLSDLDMEEENA